MSTTRLVVTGLLLMPCAAIAADYEFRTRFEIEAAQNVAEGYAQKMEFQARPELHVFPDADSEITAIARVRADAEDRLEVGRPLQEEVSEYSQRAIIGSHGDAELRELYYKQRFGQSYLTVGKQQVVWGTADGLRVLDVVNPFSFREFLLEDFDEARIPLWMVNYIHSIGSDTDLQLLVIPDLTFNDFPDGDGDEAPEYAITSPRFQPGFPADAPPNLAGVTNLGLQRPSDSLQNADAGLRLSTRLGELDLTFNYLYQYDDNPVPYRRINNATGQPVLEFWQEYERTHLLGSTLSTDLSSTLVLRYEIGLVHGRRVLRENLNNDNGVLNTDELSYVLGLDWSGVADTMFSVQLFQSVLKDDAPDLVRDKVDSTVTFNVNSRFFNDTLTLEFMALHNLNDHDDLFRPSVTYAVLDGVNIWLGADIFTGEEAGVFGQFGETDRVLAGVEWYW
ncbi:MAG: hypothetical protein HPY82_10045 [Gammaproteobacteria bacterium]|nr:hypothetical protein [Gammaproteobacteria bacterium]